MAPRSKVNQTQDDATEFGVSVRCGGWRLGLLVARNVAKGTAGRPKADDNRSLENDSAAKVSMNQFADLAGVSVSHVKYYYDAWELAAKAKLVPAAESINIGDDDVCIDADAIEVEDDPKTQWSWFYSLAKNPPKPKEQPKKQQPKPKADRLPEDDDESDSLDEDFGIESFTKEQAAEADSSIQRNDLLEVLESVRTLQSRLEKIGIAWGENTNLLCQIGSAALDLSTTASAMTIKEGEASK